MGAPSRAPFRHIEWCEQGTRRPEPSPRTAVWKEKDARRRPHQKSSGSTQYVSNSAPARTSGERGAPRTHEKSTRNWSRHHDVEIGYHCANSGGKSNLSPTVLQVPGPKNIDKSKTI